MRHAILRFGRIAADPRVHPAQWSNSIDTDGCRCVRGGAGRRRATLQFEGGASKNRTLTNAQGVVTPNSAKTVAHGVSGETITGTGFTIGANAQATLSPTSTGLTVKVPKSSSNASTVDSSLRVEEVGTIHLTVGGTHFQSTLTQLTDFATTDGGFVASTQSHMARKPLIPIPPAPSSCRFPSAISRCSSTKCDTPVWRRRS